MDIQAISQASNARLTRSIVSAFVSRNSVPATDLATLIRSVGDCLASLAVPRAVGAAPKAPEPAVSIKRSVTPDYIICLEDGRKFKSLKRHLASFNLTPDEYRAKWGLPNDYPMVSPSYAAQRSRMAKSKGLGARRGTGDIVQPPEKEPGLVLASGSPEESAQPPREAA